MTHVSFLDPYQPRPSPVHHLDPRVKLILTLSFILATTLIAPGAWPIYVLLLALILAVEIASELGVGFVWRRSALALPFVGAAVPIIFSARGTALFSVPLGPWLLTVTQAGVERFISILLKSWLSVQAAVLLASTTTFPDLLLAMRGVRMPRLLVAIIGLMWRYLFVLADEALRLLRARAARSSQLPTSGRQGGGSLAWRARVTGGMAGNLFLRSFERADRIYGAMASRGYDGEVRALSMSPLTPAAWLAMVLGLLILSLLVVLSYLL